MTSEYAHKPALPELRVEADFIKQAGRRAAWDVSSLFPCPDSSQRDTDESREETLAGSQNAARRAHVLRRIPLRRQVDCQSMPGQFSPEWFAAFEGLCEFRHRLDQLFPDRFFCVHD